MGRGNLYAGWSGAADEATHNPAWGEVTAFHAPAALISDLS